MPSRLRQQLDLESPVVDLSTRTYLTPRQAVEYLGLPSLKALRCRMDRKSIPSWCWTRMGGSLRFLRTSLDEWMQPAERTAAMQPLKSSRSRRQPMYLVHAKDCFTNPRDVGGELVGVDPMWTAAFSRERSASRHAGSRS